MATIDEILGGKTSRQETPPKGTQEWTEQHSRENAPISSPTPEQKPEQKPATQVDHGGVVQEFGDGIHAFMQDGTIRTKGDSGYTYSNPGENVSNVDLFKVLNPHKPQTKDELEKEKKKQKRDQIIAAIGDGISALSNLFFTTRGAPNMYDGKNNMSEKTRVRYDRLIKEREGKDAAWYAGLMRAMEADRAMLRDKEERQRYKDEIQHRNEREKIADERYEQEQARRKAKEDEAAGRWQAEFDEGKRRADRSHNLAVQTQKANKELKEKQIAATGARAVRGKQLGFSDGSGNQVSIYENVWRGSMQQVFDAITSDLAPENEQEKKKYERAMKKLDSPQKKDDYVKQNWHKSPRAAAIMLSLSKIDPATMTSEVDEGLGWGKSNDNNEETDW